MVHLLLWLFAIPIAVLAAVWVLAAIGCALLLFFLSLPFLSWFYVYVALSLGSAVALDIALLFPAALGHLTGYRFLPRFSSSFIFVPLWSTCFRARYDYPEHRVGRNGIREPSFIKFFSHLGVRILMVPVRVLMLQSLTRTIYCIIGHGNGYCYSIVFHWAFRIPARFLLGRNPSVGAIDFLSIFFPHSWEGVSIDFRTRIVHLYLASPTARGTLKAHVRVGAHVGRSAESAARRAEKWSKHKAAKAQQRMSRELDADRSFHGVDLLRHTGISLPSLPSRPHLARRGDKIVIEPPSIKQDAKRPMTQASAIANLRILLGSEVMIADEYAKTLEMAREELGERYIITSIPPATKLFRKLVEALKMPLQYVPGIRGHDAAGTCRRAFQTKMHENVRFGMVGMLSPSLVEWHLNPAAVAYYHDGGEGNVDPARINKPCNQCQSKRCKVLNLAIAQGRVATHSLKQATQLFKDAEVDYLWMINIEPNISAQDVLELMVGAGIENGFSASNIDWHVLENGSCYDSLTEQETVVKMNHVISSFSSGGTYYQPRSNVVHMFGPTYYHGTALRRTLLSRAGSALLMELNVNHDGRATSFIPDKNGNYLLAVPHPSKGHCYVRVEKGGFDRILNVFRTTVSRTVESAKIQLRQAQVTYSVAGTALTPRLDTDATTTELLAIWMVAYSEMMDEVASQAAITIEARTETVNKSLRKAPETIVSNIVKRLTRNMNEQHPLFGSVSEVRRILNACQLDGRFRTLNEISEQCYDDVYGEGFAVSGSLHAINSAWSRVKIPGIDDVSSVVRNVAKTTWKGVFKASDCLARALIYTEAFSQEALGLNLDIAIHIARVSGIPHGPLVATQAYLNNRHRPYARIWSKVVEAQSLDFQAAAVEILEALVNNFSPDPSVLAQVRAETLAGEATPNPVDQQALDAARTLQTRMDEIPFNRFLTELKSFMSKYNGRINRLMQLKSLFAESKKYTARLTDEQKENLEKFQDTLRSEIAKEVVSPPTAGLSPEATSHFALTMQKPVGTPVPLKPVVTNNGLKSIEAAFNDRDIVLVDAANPQSDFDGVEPRHPDQDARQIKRLPKVGGKLMFDEIHNEMQQGWAAAFLGEKTDAEIAALPDIPENARVVYSPDKMGADLLHNLARKAVLMTQDDPHLGVDPLASDDEVDAWLTVQTANSSIPAVTDALQRAQTRINNPRKPHLMHIEGLAMGGKSAGFRSWSSDRDAIIVPTNELKDEWLDSLGKADPMNRSSVYTQHVGLRQNCSRFVVVDESYTFARSHLELLRRAPDSIGMITIGDKHQIGEVFYEAEDNFSPANVPPVVVAIAPVSFVPFDCLYTYLKINNDNPIIPPSYYSGSDICRGLSYTINELDVVQPSKGDRVINGTQKGKALMRSLGVDTACTSHESQGSRSEFTYIHCTQAYGTCPDYGFLAQNRRHYGVTITRARQGNIFIVKDKATARMIPFSDANLINGLSSDSLWSGTAFDFVDPTADPNLVSYECVRDKYEPVTNTDLHYSDIQVTVASAISKEGEPMYLEEFTDSVVDVGRAKTVNTYHPAHPSTTTLTSKFQPADVKASDLINNNKRASASGKVTVRELCKVDKLVNELFNRVLDRHTFFGVVDAGRSSLHRQTREQVIKMAHGDVVTANDVTSFFFPKREDSKKVMTEGGDVKTLSVTAMNQVQLAIFAETCDILTHAFVRSLRTGFDSPVGKDYGELSHILGTYDHSYELDIEQQDSSHKPIHVAVFVKFIEMVASRLGMSQMVEEVRAQRLVGSMSGVMKVVMGCGLGSGDGWTLIANKIMAWTEIVDRYLLRPCDKITQTGDDITSLYKLRVRLHRLSGIDTKVKYTITDNTVKKGNTTFISYTCIAEDYMVAKRMRGLQKMAFDKRSQAQHYAYAVEIGMLLSRIGKIGLPEYATIHSALFGTDPQFFEDLITRCQILVNIKFKDLPDHLRHDQSAVASVQIFSKHVGCFGYALAWAVDDNVKALNALHERPVSLSEAIDKCKEENVEYWYVDAKWSEKSSKAEVAENYVKRHTHQPVVYLYQDHAVCARSVNSTMVTQGGTVKYKVFALTGEWTETEL